MSRIVLTMTKKLIDTDEDKIITEGDVLVNLTYKNGCKVEILYDAFVRFINEDCMHIDVDNNFIKVEIDNIISWS